MGSYDFIDVVFATKDDLFGAVRKAMFRDNERYHDDRRYLIKEEYRSMMNTIKKIPDNAINCCLEIVEDWFDGEFVYSLSYDIPKEQQYSIKQKGTQTVYYTNYNRDLWDDLQDL